MGCDVADCRIPQIAALFSVDSWNLGPRDYLNLFRLCHQRLHVIEIDRDRVLDTVGVSSRTDVLETRGRLCVRNLKSKVPQVLPSRHLSPSKFEKSLI